MRSNIIAFITARLTGLLLIFLIGEILVQQFYPFPDIVLQQGEHLRDS